MGGQLHRLLILQPQGVDNIQQTYWQVWTLLLRVPISLHAGLALKSWFCDFLNFCMRQLKITKIWRRALVVAIPKPEKPLGDPKSYRPISLLCVSFKILARLIYETITDPLLLL